MEEHRVGCSFISGCSFVFVFSYISDCAIQEECIGIAIVRYFQLNKILQRFRVTELLSAPKSLTDNLEKTGKINKIVCNNV